MQRFDEVKIIQPPLVQLNSPYPSGAYLSAFFRSLALKTEWKDLSLELFLAIFSRSGLTKLFALSEKSALEKANRAEKAGDEATAFNLRRYVSEKDDWINWIDDILSMLTSGNGRGTAVSGRELCHRFIFSPYSPRGYRMQQYIDSLEKEPTTDDARAIASFALADIADYITSVFDKNFALIRYAESLTINETHFSEIEKAVSSPVLEAFYKPILDSISIDEGKEGKEGKRTLICISVPFPGTFTASLYTGKYFKEKYGEKVFVSIGGGFVNTELRSAKDKALAKYIDAISFDRGYGSYYALFNADFEKDRSSLYKMRLFIQNEKDIDVIEPLDFEKAAVDFEEEKTVSLVPDYTGIDFSLYPRLVDDTNSMHRLWSDGTWMKAYLAHGCYWHKCAFCDVTLDYVCAYKMTNVKNLYACLYEQSKKSGVRGVHFVDEACPPVSLASFAYENAKKGTPISSWGNVRFEKTFTRDIADFISFGGVIGVSGGIEIATGNGLDDIHKGTDIDSIAGSCAAFKEAGILVHAYMIFGYWEENAQMLIDSLETLRQFFALGLIDSAFYHKFVLTRHSRIYKEWKEGKYPKLKPIIPKDTGIFAKNGLHFEGEEKSERYEAGLNAAIESWMHGMRLEENVRSFFSFKMPSPSIPRNYVEKAIERYEERTAIERKAMLTESSLTFWLGGKIVYCANTLIWTFMQSEERLNLATEVNAKKVAELLYALRPSVVNSEARKNALEYIPAKVLQKLRGRGLCLMPQWNSLKSD